MAKSTSEPKRAWLSSGCCRIEGQKKQAIENRETISLDSQSRDELCLAFRTMGILSQIVFDGFCRCYNNPADRYCTPSMEPLHATETKYRCRIVTHRSSSVPEFCPRPPGSNRAATPAATGPAASPRRPLSRLAARTDHHCLHQPSGDSRRRQLARPQ